MIAPVCITDGRSLYGSNPACANCRYVFQKSLRGYAGTIFIAGRRETAGADLDGRQKIHRGARAPARVNAVLPVRYTCVIGGKEKLIYFEPERMRWFVEVRL